MQSGQYAHRRGRNHSLTVLSTRSATADRDCAVWAAASVSGRRRVASSLSWRGRAVEPRGLQFNSYSLERDEAPRPLRGSAEVHLVAARASSASLRAEVPES
jgi:hypothetical protein